MYFNITEDTYYCHSKMANSQFNLQGTLLRNPDHNFHKNSLNRVLPMDFGDSCFNGSDFREYGSFTYTDYYH